MASPTKIVVNLKSRYAEPHRTYHNWHHIEALLRWMDSGEFSLHDQDAVRWAILFHDAIYDPMSKENEERSAQLAEVELASSIDAEKIALVVAMIRATAVHKIVPGLEPAAEADLAHFLDMDLSILGAESTVFDLYEQNIRAEYAQFPDDLFWPGRMAVLKRFLDRDRLYFSDWGFKRFEAKARSNLHRSIEAIAQKLI